MDSGEDEGESNPVIQGIDQSPSRKLRRDLNIDNISNKVVEVLTDNMEKVDLVNKTKNVDGPKMNGETLDGTPTDCGLKRLSKTKPLST